MSGTDKTGRALVTGGAGFIGSHLCTRLLSEGLDVRVLDDFSSGSEANLAEIRDQVDLRRGDLRDDGLLKEAVAGVDFVFHQAAIPAVPRSVADPLLTSSVNLDGTLRLLEASRQAGVKRLVFASTCAVYGDDPAMPKVETQPTRLLSPYALQKYGAERYCRLYTELYGLETVALRYFNVYGPRQDPAGDYAAVIPLFAQAISKGDPVKIFGDGEQTRDFVYVGDVVEANWRAATVAGASGNVLNVASGQQMSIRELAHKISECVGRSLEVEHCEPRAGDIQHSWADVSRLADVLDFRPGTRLHDGLTETLRVHQGATH